MNGLNYFIIIFFCYQVLNGEAPPEVLPPAPDYPPELSETCDQVAVEGANVEEALDPGTQRQYSLQDFELIK